jgi:hypothetical protein|nr:MAG TPA: hypothetical protein [Caudoviricetes sp.]
MEKDEKYSEELQSLIGEMLDNIIDNIGKNKKDSTEDEEEMYITPRVGHSYEEAKESLKRIEAIIKKQKEDND